VGRQIEARQLSEAKKYQRQNLLVVGDIEEVGPGFVLQLPFTYCCDLRVLRQSENGVSDSAVHDEGENDHA
jgi:hypothetical protein